MKTQLTNCAIHTSALADLDYVQRKLACTAQLLNKPEESPTQLAMAQGVGIRFAAHGEDGSLLEVENALQFAKRMGRENKYEGANTKLQTTPLQLDADWTLREGHESGNGYGSTTA